MTANQLQYQQNLETKRHDEAYEAEVSRHNIEGEGIERERNRIDENYKNRMATVAEEQQVLEQMKFEYAQTRDYLQLFGHYPNVMKRISRESGGLITHNIQPWGDVFHVKDGKIENVDEAFAKYEQYLLREQESIKNDWDKAINAWYTDNQEYTLGYLEMVNNYYKSRMEMTERQSQALDQFMSSYRDIALMPAQEKVLKRQAQELGSKTTSNFSQSWYYDELTLKTFAERQYQEWYNENIKWMAVWDRANQTISGAGQFMKGIPFQLWPDNSHNHQIDFSKSWNGKSDYYKYAENVLFGK